MMMVGVIFSSIFIYTNCEKKNILFLICLLISIFISTLNFSTTFYVSYFISIIVLSIFLYKKIHFYFYLLNFFIMIFFSSFFLMDMHCKKKITDFSIQNIIEHKVEKGSKNLTTVIYERSAVVTLRTLQSRPFGWGLNGMIKANEDLIDEQGYKQPYVVSTLNIEDGLNNFFKIIITFLTFKTCFFFITLEI